MLFLFLFVANIYLIFFFLISASEDLKELLTTVEGININPHNTLKFSVQCLSHSIPICVCYFLLFLLARIAWRLTIAFQINLPKRKILLCTFQLKLNNILRWHETIFVCTFTVSQMSALRESPKCLQSSLIPELHEINVFLLNLRGSLTASCGLCPTGSPWRLNPASHLLVSGENPWDSLKVSETRRDRKREEQREKQERQKKGEKLGGCPAFWGIGSCDKMAF